MRCVSRLPTKGAVRRKTVSLFLAEWLGRGDLSFLPLAERLRRSDLPFLPLAERLRRGALSCKLDEKRIFDKKWDLYYFGARYYDPSIGRWLTPDPAEQDHSPYIYCGNNPLVRTDPDGRFWGAVIGAAVDYGLQVTKNRIEGKSWSESVTQVDGASIAISAGAGLLSGGVSSLAKGCKAAKYVTMASNALINVGEVALKDAAAGKEFSANGALLNAGLGVLSSKAGDLVDNALAKQLQNVDEAGAALSKAERKLGGLRTNSPTAKKTFNKATANATAANANYQKALNNYSKAVNMQNAGVSSAASSTVNSTGSAVINEEER